MSEEPVDVLRHYGTLHKSGRYPWGSGQDPHQNNRNFLAYVDDLKKQGLSEKQVAEGVGMNTTQLRAAKAIAKNEVKKADMSRALRLKDNGLSNVEIGKAMGIGESSVRALLDPSVAERNDVLVTTANMLRDQVKDKGLLDIGEGTEAHLGISQTKLNTAAQMLVEEGYRVDRVKVKQLGTGQYTTIKVLSPPGTTYSEILQNQDKIKSVATFTEDGGRSYTALNLETPTAVSSKRVGVRYAEEGGAQMDGVIQVRRGVDDVSLQGARYAQVRISVDGTHYLKGMAMYSDDLPPGVDLMFNTNKSNTGNKLDAMKKQKDDPDNPFGSTVRQRYYIDKDGKKQLSAMNIVNEEGTWYSWSHNLSSQMLSKQSPALAKQQLDLTFAIKQSQYDEITALTNPVVRQKLLEAFAAGADSSAVHLQAAGLPRTAQHVILPVTSLKETEVYAPQYRDGEKVVLIRHPHGGVFEIPELTVNNRNKEAKKNIGRAIDAVGIHPKVAERLSGADFDGDTVLVIPNNHGKVKSGSPLAALKDFDPKTSYPKYDGMPVMTPRMKQREMGDISNLITDMTIKGANQSELARAVKHSMVVIDAEKHELNYKQSAEDNGIKALKRKYQARDTAKGYGGASTLVSRATSEVSVPARKPRSAREGGPVDRATGKLVFTPTNESYVNKKGQTIIRPMKSTKLAETDDAFTLSSGTPIETVYATHANKLKALANLARKTALETKPIPTSSSAKVTYAKEVDSLNAKLNIALKNAPLERQAQIIANATVTQKRQSNPNMSEEDIKKVKFQALTAARNRTGASKSQIIISQPEWEAIQAGAISTNKLKDILQRADLEVVKKLATPRTSSTISAPMLTRAKTMLASGYTQAEIADALGIPTSTLNDNLSKES